MFSDSDAEAPEEITFDKETHKSCLEAPHSEIISNKTTRPRTKSDTFESQNDFVSLSQEIIPTSVPKKSKIKLSKYTLSQSELKSLKELKQKVMCRPVERRNGILVMKAVRALKLARGRTN